MNTSPANDLNTKIAIGLVIAGAIATLVILILLYLLPEETLRLIDNANIKAVLFVIGALIVTTIGVLSYWAFHTPTVRRLTVAGWRAVLVYSAAAGGFSIFGWPRIQSLSLDDETGLRAGFHLANTSLEVWPNLAVCFLGIVTMTGIYLLVGVLERRLGPDL